MKIQKEFDPIQGTTTVRIEKTREDVTPVVTYKEFISKGIENADGEIVNQRLENVLPENVATTLFQETLSDGTDIKAAVAAVTAKATIEYAEKNGQRAVIEMKYRQPTGDAAEGTGSAGRTVATPRITISAEGSVTITASEGDVFYTTNGSNPTSSSTAYTAAFTVADGTTVKAIAVVVEADPETGDDVEYVSSVATKKYTAASTPDPQPGNAFAYFGRIFNKASEQAAIENGDITLTDAQFAERISEEVILGTVTDTEVQLENESHTISKTSLAEAKGTYSYVAYDGDCQSAWFFAHPASWGNVVLKDISGNILPHTGEKSITVNGVAYTTFVFGNAANAAEFKIV